MCYSMDVAKRHTKEEKKMNQVSASTLKAHQARHGVSEMSDMILKSKLAAGWTEAEIVANRKGETLSGGSDFDDAEACIVHNESVRYAHRAARVR